MSEMRRSVLWSVWGVIILALVAGCRKGGDEPTFGEAIRFGVESGEIRAAKVTTAQFHDDMSVTAYLHDTPWASTSAPQAYFTDLKVLKSSGYNSGYPWLGNPQRNFSFFAYAPHGIGTLSGQELTYTVPTDLAQQKDLVVAKHLDIPANSGQEVLLSFKHPLTAISFKTHTELYSCTIESIELSGIPSRGTYHLDEQRWTSSDTPANYALVPMTTHTQGSSVELLKDDPLLILPGTLPAGAMLKVILKDTANKEHTYEVDLEGTTFQPGTHATIRLSLAGIRIELEGLPWDYHEYKKGYILPNLIQMIAPPKWIDGISTLTSLQSEVKLKIRFLRPLGVEWKATLTNGLDFTFKPGTASRGITNADREVILNIVPRKPQSDIVRRTELYLVVYGTEIDPDRTPTGDGPLSTGKGHRIVITQASK